MDAAASWRDARNRQGQEHCQLIEDIYNIIVGLGDRHNSEAYVALFGPERRVDAAQEIVEAVAGGLVPPSLFERTRVSYWLGLGVGTMQDFVDRN